MSQGGQLRLVISGRPVQRILQLSGLGDHFQSYPTVEAAYSEN